MRLPSTKIHREIRLIMLFHAGPSQSQHLSASTISFSFRTVVYKNYPPPYSLAWSWPGLNYMLGVVPRDHLTSPPLLTRSSQC